MKCLAERVGRKKSRIFRISPLFRENFVSPPPLAADPCTSMLTSQLARTAASENRWRHVAVHCSATEASEMARSEASCCRSWGADRTDRDVAEEFAAAGKKRNSKTATTSRSSVLRKRAV